MSRTGRRAGLAVLLVLLGACASASDDASSPSSSSSSTSTFVGETGSIELGSPDRPARLVAPDDVTAPAPLLVVLHGYASNADFLDQYLGVTEQARGRGLYVLLAEGSTGPQGRQFWDAAPACCNFTGTPVDDVAYLSGLIEEAVEERPIDPGRVYVLGHSNGGFMAYRLACERAEQVTAVAVLAGADQLDERACTPSEPVSVLHLHGTDDQVVAYEGGAFVAIFAEDQINRSRPSRAYPGAVDTVARWASRNGCDAAPGDGTALDLDTGLDGAETTATAHGGCAVGVDVQLDTIAGGGHIPSLDQETFGTEVLDWLLAHAR